jgi:hypothetical protein
MANKLIFYIINLFQLKIWLRMSWEIKPRPRGPLRRKGAIAPQESSQLDTWPHQPKQRRLPVVALIGLLT